MVTVMAKTLVAAIIGILLGLGGGYLLFDKDTKETAQESAEAHNSADTTMLEMNPDGSHNHPMLEVDKSKPIPTLRVETIKDNMSGWNLHLITENYTFTGADVNKEPQPNMGHAHVYVNGTKVARPYTDWVHVGAEHFKDGENKILVTLNANNHAEWVVDGKHIQAEATVTK